MDKITSIKNLGLTSLCLAAIAMATIGAAQSQRHDKMDGRAAERDIDRLMIDRADARANHNWGKVKQDNRLMNRDWHFVRKDYRRAHADYYPFH